MDALDAILYLERGPQPNLRYPLQQEQTTIGRGGGNDLVLVDPEVSRRHARIVRQPHQYAVEDLGSTNGTFVNGQRVSSLTALQDADVIDLGDTIRLRFVLTSPPPVANEVPVYSPVASVAGGGPAVASPPPPPQPVWDPPVATEAPAYIPPVASPNAPPEFSFVPAPPPAQSGGRRGFWLGCGLLLALLLVCLGTFLLLDAFQGGRLLYCGALRPIFEFLLGPFGFAPIC
jgi:predicted component of type VI protein secretion system